MISAFPTDSAPISIVITPGYGASKSSESCNGQLVTMISAFPTDSAPISIVITPGPPFGGNQLCITSSPFSFQWCILPLRPSSHLTTCPNTWCCTLHQQNLGENKDCPQKAIHHIDHVRNLSLLIDQRLQALLQDDQSALH